MKQTSISIKLVLAAATVLGLSASRTSQAQYTVVNLGALPSGVYSHAAGINNQGVVVGDSGTGVFSGGVEIPHAFMWSRNGGMVDLGVLTGGTRSWATAVSDGPWIAGYSEVTGGYKHAFVWTPQTGLFDIGTLTGGHNSYAYGLSMNGEVVGAADDAAGHWHAFRWYVNPPDPLHPTDPVTATFQDLGNVTGGVSAYAYAINSNHEVVGYAEDVMGNKRAIHWDPTHGMVNEGVLTGGEHSILYSINDSGKAAGISDDVTGIPQLITWDAADGMVGYGTLATLSTDPAMAYINASGQIAGLLGADGFLFENQAPSNLSGFISGSSVTWSAVSGIDNAGEIIGGGKYPLSTSPEHAILLTKAASVANIRINVSTLTGGQAATGTLTLTTPAPTTGATVTLSSGNAAVTVQPAITFTAGESTATFSLKTIAVAHDATVSVTASMNGGSVSANLTVKAPTFSGLSLSAASVIGGDPTSGTVRISSAAPAGGMTVTISSNNGAAQVPGSVTIPAGLTQASFTIKTTAQTKAVQAQITTTLNGVSAAQTLSITPVIKLK